MGTGNKKGTGSTVNDSQGDGTVIEETNGNNGDCTKSFYTIESENGYIYYLIIDNAESEENVYFLDKVKEEDLINLAERETKEEPEEEKTGLFSKEPQEPETESEEVQEEPEKSKQGNNYIMIVVVMLAVLGVGYYIKIYKPKHKMLDDAYDLEEDFEAVEDSELEKKETFIPQAEEETEEKE